MTIKDRVKELAGEEGFWRSDTETTLVKLIIFLKKKGVPEDEAFEVVSSAFQTGCEEHGG